MVTAPLPSELDALVSDLRSPDPAVRDGGAYASLGRLYEKGGLDDHLVELGDRGLALLMDSEVQARTFGALLIALVADRDRLTGRASDGAVRRWLDGVAGWYADEPDTRGWDDRLGWLHAVAHGADAVLELARSGRVGRDGLLRLLRVLVYRATALTTSHWSQNEDERVALAVMAVLQRDVLDAAHVAAAVR